MATILKRYVSEINLRNSDLLSRERGLNSPPPRYECGALPTELSRRFVAKIATPQS